MRLHPDNWNSADRSLNWGARAATDAVGSGGPERGLQAASPGPDSDLFSILKSSGHSALKRPEGRAPQILGTPVSARAFTLIEMIVVLAIIGLLAALTLPHIRGHTESVAIEAAARQLMDDLAYARLRAISQRGSVAIVFIAPKMLGFFPINNVGSYNTNEQATVKRLHGGVYTHYALYEYRKAGEQPGSFDSHGYITEWKSLPEKTFIEPAILDIPQTVADGLYLAGSKFPFPLSSSVSVQDWLPYVAFDQEGRCIKIEKDETGSGKPGRDVEIRLARGSILFTREADGSILPANLDVQQIPPNNATNTVIHIDAVTGRARRIETQLP